jgi:CrcB protein
MTKLIALGVAGAAGTLARYWVSGWVARRYGESFPAGTLAVNLMGCLLVGALYYLLEERFLSDPVLRTALLLGFLGAFTTFSSYGIQVFALLRDGEFLYAAVYAGISNLAGFLLVWAGYSLSRWLAV